MKLSKTEKAILERIAKNPNSLTSVESGLHRGKGHTGKLRPYGVREFAAAVSLRDKGLVTLEISNNMTYHRGYGEHHTETLVRGKS